MRVYEVAKEKERRTSRRLEELKNQGNSNSIHSRKTKKILRSTRPESHSMSFLALKNRLK